MGWGTEPRDALKEETPSSVTTSWKKRGNKKEGAGTVSGLEHLTGMGS